MNNVACEACGTDYAAGLPQCPTCGAGSSEAIPRLPKGTRLQGGRFTVGRVLGRGGFGITYKGAHKELRRPVAIKELFPKFASRVGLSVTVSADLQDSFRRDRKSVVREARVLAGLDAPGIVNVHDFFNENGTAYIVLEYLEGPTLAAAIKRQGRLPPAEVGRVAAAVCEALAAVHGAGLLHRDVKPANILLARNDRVVLLDFGSARAYEAGQTQSHTIVVTPDYGAPEQFGSKGQFGPYTDLFGLGATLYHALTGAPPTPGAVARLQAGQATVSLPSSVPKNLRRAVEATLHIHIADRPQSVADFRVLLGTGTQPPDKGWLRHNLKSVTRSVAMLLVLVMAALILYRIEDRPRTVADFRDLFGTAMQPLVRLATVSDTPATGGALPGSVPYRWGWQRHDAPEDLLTATRDSSRVLFELLHAPGPVHHFTLHTAAWEGNADDARALLGDVWSSVNAQDKNGWTPLFWAAGNGHAKVARILLDAGAHVDIQDQNGNTPLHLVASGLSQDHIDVARALLDAGAKVDIRNSQGSTPIQVATATGNSELARILEYTNGVNSFRDKESPGLSRG